MRRAALQNRTIIRCLVGLALTTALGFASPGAIAQSMSPRVLPGGAGGGGGIAVIPSDPMLNPDSPEARAYAAVQRKRRTAEREMRILSRRHFGSIRVTETREIGLRKIRGYTSEPAIMAMIDVFDDQGEDVRTTVLDHISTLSPGVAFPTLAWEAVRGDDAWYRALARETLTELIDRDRAIPTRVVDEQGPMPAVRGIIADGLRSPIDDRALAASDLVRSLKLFEFIPLMAAAQVAQRPVGAQGQGGGDLGWIMIGRQQAYVADLQPVVSNSAVAFDPQIGIATDGVMLRIHDAVVTAYRTEIHTTLVDWTTDAWGRSTGGLGYEPDRWKRWYDSEFVPSRVPAGPEPDSEPDATGPDSLPDD